MIGFPDYRWSEFEFDYQFQIERVKMNLQIYNADPDMTDDEIKKLLRQFGMRQADTTIDQYGEVIFGNAGLTAMVVVALYFFPRFYEQEGMSQIQ